jgi:peptidoglycan hydrolase CwlO-like protein
VPIVAIAVLGASMLGPQAGADTAGDLRKAKSELDAVMQRIDDATTRVNGLRGHLVVLLTRVDASRRAVERDQAKIVDTQLTIRAISETMQAQQAAVDERAVRAYMVGPGAEFVQLLGATSLQDLQERMADLQVGSERGQQASGDLAVRQASLSANEADLQALYITARAAQDQLDADVQAVESELALRQGVLDQLAVDRVTALRLVKRLTVQRQREIAKALAQQRSKNPPPPPGGHENVVALIHYYFAPLGQGNVDTALCVGWRESRYIPTAVNPSSGASGVFQFMPRLWPWFSSTAGWRGANVFDPVANVAVAAYIAGHFGWSPWHSDSGYCNT